MSNIKNENDILVIIIYISKKLDFKISLINKRKVITTKEWRHKKKYPSIIESIEIERKKTRQIKSEKYLKIFLNLNKLIWLSAILIF